MKSKFGTDANGNTLEFERIGIVLDFENEKDKKLFFKYEEKGKEGTYLIQIN